MGGGIGDWIGGGSQYWRNSVKSISWTHFTVSRSVTLEVWKARTFFRWWFWIYNSLASAFHSTVHLHLYNWSPHIRPSNLPEAHSIYISTSSTFYLQQHKISSPIIRTVNFPPKNRVSERARNFHLNIKGENPSEELTTWERNLLQEKWIFHEWKRHLEKKVFLQERLCFRSPHECLGNQVFFGSTT